MTVHAPTQYKQALLLCKGSWSADAEVHGQDESQLRILDAGDAGWPNLQIGRYRFWVIWENGLSILTNYKQTALEYLYYSQKCVNLKYGFIFFIFPS